MDLITASKEGNLEEVKVSMYFDQYKDRYEQYFYHSKALISASHNGHLEVVRYLVDHGADVNAKDQNGWTALLHASDNGHLEVVSYLLEQGADVYVKDNEGISNFILPFSFPSADLNVEDNEGWSALSIASRKGYLEIVNVLLLNGANIDAKNKNRETALMLASGGGHFEVVRYLVEHGAEKDNDGETALMKASGGGHYEVVRYLVEEGADVNAHYGWTALMKASENGHLEIVKYLVAQGADVNYWEPFVQFPESVLEVATRQGHLDVVKYLVEQGAKVELNYTSELKVVQYLVEQGAVINDEVVFSHAQSGNLEVLQYLIQQGANVNSKNCYGYRALNIASENGHLEVVKTLLRHGANDEPDVESDMALMLASAKGHLEIVKCLLSKVPGEYYVDYANGYSRYTASMYAISKGHLEILKYLVAHGADVNVDPDFEWGLTPLMVACDSGYLNVVQYLVEQGADVNAHDCSDRTPLDYAINKGYLEIINYVKHHEKDKRDKNGNTALMHASKNTNIDKIKQLIADGADVNAQNNEGESALSFVPFRYEWKFDSDFEVMKYLVEHGADVNAKDNDGNTALMLASMRGHLEVVKYLFEHGANVNEKSDYGNTALMKASMSGHLEVVKYLFEHGADVNAKNYDGSTALMLSSRWGQLEVVKFLEEHKTEEKEELYLFFDTETTGLPLNWKAPVTDLNNWPRLVQLAYLLYDNKGNKISEGNFIIKPEGFTIPLEASKIHRITNEIALKEGQPIGYVLQLFNTLIAQANYLVAHNMAYDEKIIGSELLRNGIQNSLPAKNRICTMERTTNLCAINGPYGYKWPKLSELHYKLFGTNFEESHNAAADINATARCFWELRRLGKI